MGTLTPCCILPWSKKYLKVLRSYNVQDAQSTCIFFVIYADTGENQPMKDKEIRVRIMMRLSVQTVRKVNTRILPMERLQKTQTNISTKNYSRLVTLD